MNQAKRTHDDDDDNENNNNNNVEGDGHVDGAKARRLGEGNEFELPVPTTAAVASETVIQENGGTALLNERDTETHHLQMMQQQQEQQQQQISLVAAALAADQERTSVTMPSSVQSVSTALSPNNSSNSNLQQMTASGFNDDYRSSRNQSSDDNAHADLSVPEDDTTSRLSETIQIQQELLRRQQQQQLSAFNQQQGISAGMRRDFNFQDMNANSIQQQLAMNANRQMQASAMHHGQFNNGTGNFSAGMLRNPRMDNFDAQYRQRQLLEFAALQNHQRNLWLSLNYGQLSNSASISHERPQPTTFDDVIRGNFPTRVAISSGSHLISELPQGNNSSNASSALLTGHDVSARMQKKKVNQLEKDSKATKRKSKQAVSLKEYNFEPDNVKELSLPSDSDHLSEYQCVLRKQIVLFTVCLDDVQCSAQGRNKPITIGQVGVVCRYCAKLKPGMRPSGSVYFPAKLSGLYQASQNMAINHFSKSCDNVPDPIRQHLLELKERRSTVLGGGKHFWANCATAIGVVEQDDQLRFTNESTKTVAVINNGDEIS